MCQYLQTYCQFVNGVKTCNTAFIDMDRSVECPDRDKPMHNKVVIEEKQKNIPSTARCDTCKNRDAAINVAVDVYSEVIFSSGHRAETPASNLGGPRVQSPSTASQPQYYQPAPLPGAATTVASPASSGYDIKPRGFYNSMSESSDSEHRGSSNQQGSSHAPSSTRSSQQNMQQQFEVPSSSSGYPSSSDDNGRDTRKSSSAGSNKQGRQDTGKKRKVDDRSSSNRSSGRSSGGRSSNSDRQPPKKK